MEILGILTTKIKLNFQSIYGSIQAATRFSFFFETCIGCNHTRETTISRSYEMVVLKDGWKCQW